MSQIITFYSYKGGVGRTMALANIAYLLAARHHKVLIVDFDLEAPGLHQYFRDFTLSDSSASGGVIALLESMGIHGNWDSAPYEQSVNIPGSINFPGCEITLLPAGADSNDYQHRVLHFDLESFYCNKNGSVTLDKLRNSWRERFDFVLIDSRTGITDIGGICTIFLPDIVALVFTANEQSFSGVIDVVSRAQTGRQLLSVDRGGLTVFPIPSRFDSRTEQEEAEIWMERFSRELSPHMETWRPKEISVRTILERTKIPHVPFFSFGEKLPVVTHSLSDPDLPGFYYQNIARIFDGNFAEKDVYFACGIFKEPPVSHEPEGAIIDVSRLLKYAPTALIGRHAELDQLNAAWQQATDGNNAARARVYTLVALGGEGKTSLVAHWLASLADQGWPGCDAAFAWSFYSQGASDQSAASGDLFLREALRFFGDPAMADSAAGAHEKGQRLASLIGQQRTLLILDGLEPLQFAPTSPTPGLLKDQGVAVLLKSLAAQNPGLCVVTTRYQIADLNAYTAKGAPQLELHSLSAEAGEDLLRKLGVTGSSKEFADLVKSVQGHALSLNLLGAYLRDAHGGDIRKADRINLFEADEEEQGGHAFRVMDANFRWLESDGEKGQRALALLRLTGLFDRSADAGCLTALLLPPAIDGLTDALVNLSEAQRNIALARLETAHLLTVNRAADGNLISLDAHPLLREYFAAQLRDSQPEAWRAAHRRIFEHLCETTKEGKQPTLEALQPLYQAVAHGCWAGMHEEARAKVYRNRILRGNEFYSTKKLGAFASDLRAVVCFFEQPWRRLAPALSESGQAWLLNEAAYRLRALGRLSEALEPMRTGLEMGVKQENWDEAARRAGHLSELEVTLGALNEAVADGALAMTYADQSGDEFMRLVNRAAYADALQQAGRADEAVVLFREAEAIQAKDQPAYPFLYSVQGFQYCELLLAPAERAAWQRFPSPAGGGGARGEGSSEATNVSNNKDHLATCTAVIQRATQTIKIAESNNWLLDIALDHLTLGRAALTTALLGGTSPDANCRTHLESAVTGLHCAGTTHHLPRGLLTRAWLRAVEGHHCGAESAQSDLDEAWEIAERGPMPLFLADIHLHRARLFGDREDYPWDSPQADLQAARKLIEKHGYGRRKAELEDAERAFGLA